MLRRVLLSLALGIVLGIIAKYSDTVSAGGWYGMIWDTVSTVTTRLGIWVFAATLLALFQPNPKTAAGSVFAFFAGLLAAYYVYSMQLFGFFPTYYAMRWGAIALVSPLAAYAVWFARRDGLFAAVCAAAPVGLLLSEGYPYLYTRAAAIGFDLLAALMLLVILPRNGRQRLLMLPAALLIAFVLHRTYALAYIIGGL